MQFHKRWLVGVVASLCSPSVLFVVAASRGSGPSLRSCSDAELASYALLAATGPDPGTAPLEPPRCQPAAGQGVGPPLVAGQQHTSVHAQPPRQLKLHIVPKRAPPRLVHLYVVQSYSEWCKAPCKAATWELAAPKSSPGSPYVLFEVAIWKQENRVALYRFDPAWMETARRAYNDVCSGIGWECGAYRAFREQRSLLSLPWLASVEKDREAWSEFLLNAFQRFFAKIAEEAPAPEHFALTYSGHGSRADGSLFEGVVTKEDAAKLLESAAADIKRPEVLNFGGNCAEGRWNMVANLYPFADWIIVSDLKVGGVELTGDERSMKFVRARERLSDVTVLKETAEAGVSIRETVERIVTSREEIWKTVWNGAIERQQLRQSIAVISGPDFGPFKDALRAAYVALPRDQRKPFELHVEDAECDVLAGVHFLEGHGAKGLEAKFKDMRPLFTSTMPMVKWKVELHGLGFNFNGWNKAPCDLPTALGDDAPLPAGGWSGGGTPIPLEYR